MMANFRWPAPARGLCSPVSLSGLPTPRTQRMASAQPQELPPLTLLGLTPTERVDIKLVTSSTPCSCSPLSTALACSVVRSNPGPLLHAGGRFACRSTIPPWVAPCISSPPGSASSESTPPASKCSRRTDSARVRITWRSNGETASAACGACREDRSKQSSRKHDALAREEDLDVLNAELSPKGPCRPRARIRRWMRQDRIAYRHYSNAERNVAHRLFRKREGRPAPPFSRKRGSVSARRRPGTPCRHSRHLGQRAAPCPCHRPCGWGNG